MAEITNDVKASKADEKRKKYRCIEKCFWSGTLYHEGDTVDVPSNVTPPEWFNEVK